MAGGAWGSDELFLRRSATSSGGGAGSEVPAIDGVAGRGRDRGPAQGARRGRGIVGRGGDVPRRRRHARGAERWPRRAAGARRAVGGVARGRPPRRLGRAPQPSPGGQARRAVSVGTPHFSLAEASSGCPALARRPSAARGDRVLRLDRARRPRARSRHAAGSTACRGAAWSWSPTRARTSRRFSRRGRRRHDQLRQVGVVHAGPTSASRSCSGRSAECVDGRRWRRRCGATRRSGAMADASRSRRARQRPAARARRATQLLGRRGARPPARSSTRHHPQHGARSPAACS